MIADRVLPLFDGVRQTGEGRWIARCPVHDDHSPSLSIREVEDRLLLHCFAGCPVGHVVGALGLDLADLFPASREHHAPLHRPFPADDVLRCLAGEITFLQLCASDQARGEQLSVADRERLQVSVQRFAAALEAARL